jgi:multiple sugar transport system ATP-binding protein
MNLVPAHLDHTAAGLVLAFEGGLRVPVPARKGAELRAGMDVVMGLRTEDLTIDNGDTHLPDEWKAEGLVEVVEPLGSETNLHMDLSGTKMIAKSEGRELVEAGKRITLAMNLNHLHIFDAQTHGAIY